MSEPKRTARVPAFACLVVLLNLGWLTPFCQVIVGTQLPIRSAEDERRTIEAERQRMSQPEARRERLLLGDLGSAMERYYWDRDASSRSECESLLTKVLALPKPSARAYSTCAATASLLDRPRQAIEIVKKAIAEYPEEHVEGPILPLEISGYYRIGALATRIGDVNEATRAYETIISNARDNKGKEYLTALCYMCLADLAHRTPGQEHVAPERLRQVMKIMESVNRDTRDRNDLGAIDLMKSWAAYELARVESSSAAPDPALSSMRNRPGDAFMVVVVWATLGCPSRPELEQMAASERPSILRTLAGLGLAFDCLHRPDPFKAEKHLLTVVQDDSYFKAPAQAALESVREEMRKIREKIPALVSDLRHGSPEQQEQAVSQLVYSAGTEGIKSLLEAQANSDKRVRCLAACTLANQSIDRSVKARFDVVLEAFTDDDAEMRSKASGAIGFRSCLKVGPRETVALIRLMKEHYSGELRHAVQEWLFEVRGKPEIMNVAFPELAALVGPADRDALEGILDIFQRIEIPPVPAVAALAQRLDQEEDEYMQTRIISMLGWTGPAARQAVPVLTKCARHGNPNIREATASALRRITAGETGRAPDDTPDR
jgi:tetratricopeptide (TPR) repeat protein